MGIRAVKYLSPFLIYLGAIYSFTSHGIICFAPLIYSWIIIPFLELFLQPDQENLSEVEEDLAKQNVSYDLILYSVVILQYFALFLFLESMKEALPVTDRIARIAAMGLLCGTFGINVGHELGHRVGRFEQILAKLLLLSSLYMHFFIEHNKGHHKNVATPHDPSSARFGEIVYTFWFRTIVYSYINAWRIANAETEKKGLPKYGIKNEMVQVHIIQLLFVMLIFLVFGLQILACYFLAALMGILLLETVNYIEHYGLSRKSIGNGKYERAMPVHSWNSSHIIGRLMLFELSRHSDHHYLASRKYQVLQHHDDAPQLPTGYPGMMILSLIPPLWFYVMNRRIRKMQNLSPA